MRFISTRGNAPAVTASEAILQGLAPDGGLYVPEEFPQISMGSLAQTSSYPELAYEVMAPFFAGDVLENQLAEICMEAFDFPVEMHWHSNREAVLELFYGPTAAFKDFGARFLAAAWTAAEAPEPQADHPCGYQRRYRRGGRSCVPWTRGHFSQGALSQGSGFGASGETAGLLERQCRGIRSEWYV